MKFLINLPFIWFLIFYIINIILSILLYRISKYFENNYNKVLYDYRLLKIFTFIPVIQSLFIMVSIYDLIDLKFKMTEKITNLYDKIFGD